MKLNLADMSEYILGLNAYHPDSSACIFKDGKLLCAIEEERYSRIKHHSGFPHQAIKNCLEFCNISIKNIDVITVNKRPLSNILNKAIYFSKNYNTSNVKKFNKSISFNNRLKIDFLKFFKYKIKNITNVDHHISHLLISFYTSNFKKSNLLSVDGFGDFASIYYGTYSGEKLSIKKKTIFPNSLGVFYQAITQLLGFEDYGDEYKVMGMSAYGKNYLDIFDKIIKFKDKNYIQLNLDYFDFLNKNILKSKNDGTPEIPKLFSKNLERDLIKQRKKNEKIKQIHFDVAYSLQLKYEEIFLKIVDQIKINKFSNNLCLSGGCANNSLANGKVLNYFSNLNISYASGDNGGSIGSALNYAKKKYKIDRKSLISPYQGRLHDDSKIESIIDKKKFSIRYIESDNRLIDIIAGYLKKNLVISLYRGRSEFGPRALGNRSILANPSKKNIRDILNEKIKQRERFRPFAPSVMQNQQKSFFSTSKRIYYMTEVIFANELNAKKIDGAIHIDGTCRVQTVSKRLNAFYYSLIQNFYNKTKIPVLLNTSFNIKEPIVETPKDAYDCFERSKIDVLVINNYLIRRNVIPSS